MSDEHAPLRLLRQVFGDDIICVHRDTPRRAEVYTLSAGDVALTIGPCKSVAQVGAARTSDDAPTAALRLAIAEEARHLHARAVRDKENGASLAALQVPE
jgi:hypothetical protein